MIRRRPEIRELSPDQLQSYLHAVKALRSINGTDIYSQATTTHYNNVPHAHGVPAFFPWHRIHLLRFEAALQKVDPSINLPYWDWSRDAQAPEQSPVFTDSYFGGNGRSGDHCVTTGPFANWQLTVPGPHCLKRQFDGGSTIPAFYSSEALEEIVTRSKTYDQLRQAIEGGPNSTVQRGIGGNNGDMSLLYSPNDPLYWPVAAFADLLWAEWQARNPTLANTYNGHAGGRQVSVNDVMAPFNVPVSSTLDTRALGYDYARFTRS